MTNRGATNGQKSSETDASSSETNTESSGTISIPTFTSSVAISRSTLARPSKNTEDRGHALRLQSDFATLAGHQARA